MSPRELVRGGLPGPGQTIFSEGAKESAVSLALTDDILIFRNEGKIEGGVREEDWQLIDEVRGRVDIVGVRLPNKTTADQVNEGTTHVMRLDKDADIKSGDRVERAGERWAVLAVGKRTDEPTKYVEAKRI
jgi:hypothetical protein